MRRAGSIQARDESPDTSMLSDDPAMDALLRHLRDHFGIDLSPGLSVKLKAVFVSDVVSIGDGYGPMVIANHPMEPDEIKGKKIAIPGTLTTAYLALKLFSPKIETSVVPFDKIIPEILAGRFEAGLIIHEGQLTYENSGLTKILDLGKWWHEMTGLPLPLGGNAIRRDLGSELIATVCQALKDSIQYGLDHREEALAYAMQFARDLDTQKADRFVGMYVNERTIDYGEDGKEAIVRLLDMGYRAGIIPHQPHVEFV